MILVYCPICRRIKINADDVRKMAIEFDEIEEAETQEIRELISQAKSEEELIEIKKMVELRTRGKAGVSDELKGDQWVSLSDQEWEVIQAILNSTHLLCLVENFADYTEKCPECLAREAELAKAALN